jgi:hypothetical protein
LKDHDLTIVKSFKELYPWHVSPYYAPERKDFSLAQYDVVLTDVNLPSPVDGLRPNTVDGPTGLLVVFKALESGVKYIGAITDASHHSADPIAKGFDMWMHAEKPIQAGSSRIFLECYNACRGTKPVGDKYKYPKNWKRVLDILCQEEKYEPTPATRIL